MPKSGKAGGSFERGPKSSTGSNGVASGRFADAVRSYSNANTKSPEVARSKLNELGISDASGKLTKPYK